MFAGLAVLFAATPLNGILSVLQRNLQHKQMKFTDERIKLMSEVLSGIKVNGLTHVSVVY